MGTLHGSELAADVDERNPVYTRSRSALVHELQSVYTCRWFDEDRLRQGFGRPSTSWHAP